MNRWHRTLSWTIALLLAGTLGLFAAGCHQEEKPEADYYTGKDFKGRNGAKSVDASPGSAVAGKAGGRD